MDFPMNENQPLLKVSHVVKHYANHIALDDVSIEISHQKVVGLLGPNGAGKTSLIRIINQITAADKGELFFEGEKLSPKHIANIGYLPEERGLYKKMKVGEQALYLARLKGLSANDAKQKIRFWFEKFEIFDWWDKKVEDLSKGMQQKVQFIVTVLHDPKLLILDEPFSGFDPINANLLVKEILEMKAKGAAIMLSTHNMESVEELCDHIVLIHKSKKILDGSVKEIRNAYKRNIYEITFKGNLLAFTNALWAQFKLIENSQDHAYLKAKVQLLNDAKPNQLLEAVLPFVEVHSFQEMLPTMKEIFISKTQMTNAEIETQLNT
jgi:ABC-2 type transport system ATP-binding protein